MCFQSPPLTALFCVILLSLTGLGGNVVIYAEEIRVILLQSQAA